MRFKKEKEFKVFNNKEKIILGQIKANKNIVYGGQSIKKQIGIFGRETKDYDVYSKKPKRDADKLVKQLNMKSEGNYYYRKQAIHQGTHKVKHVGRDMKPYTDDDIEVADFTKPERKVKTLDIEGIRYTELSESKRDKQASINDPQYRFRYKKDVDDLGRIKYYETIKKMKWWFKMKSKYKANNKEKGEKKMMKIKGYTKKVKGKTKKVKGYTRKGKRK